MLVLGGSAAVPGRGGIRVAKSSRMPTQIDPFGQSSLRAVPANFWERIIHDEQLSECSPLEKLLIGCELIATLDQVDLLQAA